MIDRCQRRRQDRAGHRCSIGAASEHTGPYILLALAGIQEELTEIERPIIDFCLAGVAQNLLIIITAARVVEVAGLVSRSNLSRNSVTRRGWGGAAGFFALGAPGGVGALARVADEDAHIDKGGVRQKIARIAQLDTCTGTMASCGEANQYKRHSSIVTGPRERLRQRRRPGPTPYHGQSNVPIPCGIPTDVLVVCRDL